MFRRNNLLVDPNEITRKHEAHVEYLTANAYPGLFLSLSVFGLSLLLGVPPIGFILSSFGLGVFLFAVWTHPDLKKHEAWLTLAGICIGVLVASHFRGSMTKSVGSAQLLACYALGMFTCFAVQRLLSKNGSDA